jgi:hypothetical protein
MAHGVMFFYNSAVFNRHVETAEGTHFGI